MCSSDLLNTKIDENTRDLDSSIKNLSNVLNDYKSETSTSFTTVNNEIKNLSADITDIVAQLTQITEDQVKEVKTSLTAQIEANTDLLDSQKKEYSDLINSLESSTTTELTKKVTELQNSITSSANSNADALNSKREATHKLASASHCFGEIRYQPTDAIIIPRVSSERRRSEERRVGKECRSRWSPYH